MSEFLSNTDLRHHRLHPGPVTYVISGHYLHDKTATQNVKLRYPNDKML